MQIIHTKPPLLFLFPLSPYHIPFPSSAHHVLPHLFRSSHNVKLLLQRNHQLPLILTNLVPKELLEHINTLPANARVQDI